MSIKSALVRDTGEPQVATSPIAAEFPRPLEGPLDAREMWGYVFWGLLGTFVLITEALAAFWSGFPIPTISGTTGHLEERHHWFKLIVVGGMAVIAARITFYPWPFRRLDD
jgi:hypothetical protein